MKTFADKAIDYFTNLRIPNFALQNVSFMNPYRDVNVKAVINQFYMKYFSDFNERIFVFGINPGRFGGGLTGISFTDPVALKEDCGIDNNLGTKKELSSKFIYMVINECGGAERFFSKIFLTAIYPLALIKDGKNFNYYDRADIYSILRPQLEISVRKQINLGARTDVAVCLGKRNAEFLSRLNDDKKYFKEIKILDHPRFIMQYRLKHAADYVKQYLSALSV